MCNKRLSICIPTYNRSGCLKECLDSILRSVVGYESQIEIIISDNASTDDTAYIIHSFQINYPWLRCHRNAENIGGDRNIYLVATMALGEYIWLFGDDDKMMAGAVPAILNKIALGYNLIICNYSVWAKDFSYIIKTSGLLLGYDEVFDNPDELMRRIGYHVGYISSIIIKKDVFFKCPASEYLYYIDYGFPQIYAVYSGIFQHCNAICISSALVCNRADNYGNLDWWKCFVEGTSLIFEALSEKGYTKNAIIAAKHQVLRYVIVPNLLSMSVRDDSSLNNRISLMITYYKKNWLFWLVCLPILLMPVSLTQFVKKIIVKIRSIYRLIKIDVSRKSSNGKEV